MKKVLTLMLVVCILLSLTGCGEVQKAEKAVTGMFTAFKSLDFKKAQQYVDVDDIKVGESEEDMSANTQMFMKNLFDKLEYKIISSEKLDSDTVNVTTEITAVDMKPVLGEFMAAALEYAFSNAFSDPKPTEEETTKKMEELFAESAGKPDLKTVTTKVVIKVVKSGKDWKIVSDEMFADALLGGLKTALEELEESLEMED